MKYDYNNIQDIFPPQGKAPNKGPGKLFCSNCHKTLDEKQFFKTRRIEKFPSGFLPHCKTCVTMGVNDTDPSTFLQILKEIDVPFIPSEWRSLLNKKPIGGASVFGKYVSKMRLNNYKKYTWADSENLTVKENESILSALRQESDNESEAQNKLDSLLDFSEYEQPSINSMAQQTPNAALLYGLTPETSKYNLTKEEITELKLKWGNDYTEDEYLRLEQLFEDMKDSYIIQDPLAISNSRIICKMTMKVNKYLDIDDVESASKLSRQLDLFIKSSNLAPVQQKDRQQTTFAISQLAFLIEHESGFIPEYYIDKPNDKIDMILSDMQDFTRHLIYGESNIAEMVENTAAILAQDQLPEAVEDMDDFAALEKELLGEMEPDEEEADAVTD